MRFQQHAEFNITAAWAVDWEFVYIVGPAGVRLWADFGLPLIPFGSLWGALDSLWLPSGRLLDFVEKWTSLSEQILSKCAACRQKQASRNSATGASGSRGCYRKWGLDRSSGPTLPHAPETKMT